MLTFGEKKIWSTQSLVLQRPELFQHLNEVGLFRIPRGKTPSTGKVLMTTLDARTLMNDADPTKRFTLVLSNQLKEERQIENLVLLGSRLLHGEDPNRDNSLRVVEFTDIRHILLRS